MITKRIDFATYPRKQHFEHFIEMDNPFVNITVNVDITEWLSWLKKSGYPFFLTFQYAVVHAANRVPELRQRYVDGEIIEYDFCNPSYIVDVADGTYRYCMVNTNQPLDSYIEEGRRKQEAARNAEILKEEGNPLEQFFITCIPWFSFSAIQMPYPDRHATNPNIGWGKYQRDVRLVKEDGRIVEKETVMIPVIIMVNHALVDGRHIAEFFENLEDELRKMETVIT